MMPTRRRRAPTPTTIQAQPGKPATVEVRKSDGGLEGSGEQVSVRENWTMREELLTVWRLEAWRQAGSGVMIRVELKSPEKQEEEAIGMEIGAEPEGGGGVVRRSWSEVFWRLTQPPTDRGIEDEELDAVTTRVEPGESFRSPEAGRRMGAEAKGIEQDDRWREAGDE